MKVNKIAAILIPILIIGFYQYQKNALYEVVESTQSSSGFTNDNSRLSRIINEQKSGVILTLKGRVIKKLRDDNIGSRHQKLIFKVKDHTLLLAHNIDLAPRVPVNQGEMIEVHGEYQWNNQGGLMHWTHADKSNHHEGGWIKYKNKKYQ